MLGGQTPISTCPCSPALAARPVANSTAWARLRFIFQLPATKGRLMMIPNCRVFCFGVMEAEDACRDDLFITLTGHGVPGWRATSGSGHTDSWKPRLGSIAVVFYNLIETHRGCGLLNSRRFPA